MIGRWLSALCFLGVFAPMTAHAQSRSEAPTPLVSSRPTAAEQESKAIASHLDATFEPAFCHKTTVPVPEEIQKYCTLASELPNCKELSDACTATFAPKPTFATPAWTKFLVWGLVVVLGVVALIALVTLIVRSLRRVQRDEDLAEAMPAIDAFDGGNIPTEALFPNVDDPEALLRLGDARANSGEFTMALALYLAASLKSLDRRGVIALGPDRTNGEYVRACGDPDAQQDLRRLVNEVDKVHFGGASPSRDQVSVVRSYAASLLRVAMMVIVLFAFATGCKGSSSTPIGKTALSDPLGHDLARVVLTQRGFNVESWNKPLDRLATPDPDDPWIIVDAQRFQLGDESRAHVVSWIEAGGKIALFGHVDHWPKEFQFAYGSTPPDRTIELVSADAVARARSRDPYKVEKPTAGKAASAHSGLVSRLGGTILGRYSDGSPYAVKLRYGKGQLIAVSSEEALTNIGLQDPAILATFVSLSDHFDGTRIAFLRKRSDELAGNGPMGAMVKAGFGTALLHGLIAALLLFVAVGYRLTAPTSEKPDRRRAFVEHIRAVAGLYQRTRSTRHALASFRRFVEERLRQRMPHWEQDIAGYISSRSGEPRAYCAGVWEYAKAADASQPPLASDLEYLRALIRLYRSATTTERLPLSGDVTATSTEPETAIRGSTAIRISSRTKTDK